MRATLAVWFLLLGATPSAAAAQGGDALFIVPSAERDDGAAVYLVGMFEGARVRRGLTFEEARRAHAQSPGVALLHLDLGSRRVRALRAGSAEILARDLPPGELSLFAIAVLSAELLALPLSPAPSTEGAEALDPPSPDASPSSEAASSEAASSDAASNEAASSQVASRDAASNEAASSDAAPNEAASSDSAANEAATSDVASREAAPSDAASSEAADDRFTLRLTASYALSVSDDPTTILHRPSVRAGVAYGTRALRGVLHVSADALGFLDTPAAADEVDRLAFARTDVRAGVGLVVGALDPLELTLDLAAGVGVTEARVVVNDGGERARVTRVAFVVGGEASIGVRIIAGLRVFLGGGLFLDPEGERLLVRGQPLVSDGPWVGVGRAGLRWETD